VITRHGGEVSSELGERVTHVLCPDLESALARRAEEMGLRLVTAHWLNDVITVKKMAAPWKGVHLPLPRAGDRGSDISSMRISVTGFEGLDRDYVKDMIEMAGAEYTACLTRDNTAIVCREAAGEKFRKSSEWNIPAVSIKWLNEALFSRENVADKLTDPRFRNFDKHKQPLGVSSKLVSSYLRPWKSVIEVTRSDYYEYKQRLSSAAEKRSLELDDRILTPGGKRRKLDPRSLFDKTKSASSAGVEIQSQNQLSDIAELPQEDDEIRFDFFKGSNRNNLCQGKLFHLSPQLRDTEKGNTVTKILKDCNGRITNSLKEFHTEVDVEASGSKMYFMISDNPAEKEESLTPVIRTVSSDYIFNSVLQCEFK